MCVDRHRLLKLALLIFAFFVSLPAMAAEKWSLAPDPAASSPTWEGLEGKGVDAPVSEVVRPATDEPIILTGHSAGSTSRDVWRLTDFTKIGTIAGRFDVLPGSFAMSTDGKLIATSKKKNFSTIGAEVWSIEAGKKLKLIDIGPAAEPLMWSGFVSATTLLTLHEAEQGQTKLRLIDVMADRPATEFAGPQNVDARLMSVSPGGHLVAVGLADGSIAIVGLGDKQPAKLVRITVPQGFGKCIGVKFSPDGTELGGLFSLNDAATQRGELAIAAWNLADGQQSVQLPDVFLGDKGQAAHALGAGAPLVLLPFEWLADGTAFLVDSSLIDRETGHVVWRLRQSSLGIEKLPLVFLGTDYLLVPRKPSTTIRLEALKLPWKDIDSALKALQSKAPAWLRPNDKLSVQFEFGGLRFQTPDQVKAALTAKFQAKLRETGFEVADSQPVTLKVAYAESAGGTLEKSDGLPFPRLPRIGPPIPRRRRMADEGPIGTGTAFIIHSDGYLLTCAHVVGSAPSVQVKIGDQTYHGRVVAKNVPLDFALLKVELKNLTALPLADSSKVELGEEVRAIGFPISGVLGESIKATRGTLAGLVKRGTRTMFQVDASINPGNSGGPLVNDLGEVVGINSAKLVGEDVDNVGFSIPINEVKTMLREQKVTFQTKGSATKLAGPELIKRVTPSVAFVTSTGGVDLGPAGAGTVVATRIACVISLIVKDLPDPVWTEQIVIEQHRLRAEGELTEEKARDLAFEAFTQRLANLSLPYFVSKDPVPVTLPITTDLTALDQQLQPASTPRKTRRGS